MKKSLFSVSVATLLASAGSVGVASTVTIPNSFTAGAKAVAADVNANFNAVKTAVDGNAGDIGTNTANISTNTTNITANTTAIGTANTAITALQAANTCPADMVAAGSICIDKYEGSIWDAATGGAQIAPTASASAADPSSLFPCVRDGSDCAVGAPAAAPIYARSVAGVTPAINITWYQAAQACANVGKRLPTTAEWQMAASGTPAGLGDGTTGCNINTGNTLGVTGNAASCVSATGALDMLGNVMEWSAEVSIIDKGFKDMSVTNSPSVTTDNSTATPITTTTTAAPTSTLAWTLGNGYKNSTGGVASVFNLFAPDAGTIATNDQIGFRCAK